MTRRTLPAAGILALLLVLPAVATPGELKEFKPEGHKFKVLMPPNPRMQKQKAAGADFIMFLHEAAAGGYMVGVADVPIPPNEAADKIQERLDGGVQGAVANIKGKLTKSEKITLKGNHPGRAMEATFDQGKLRARFYLVGNRMYQMIVVGSEDFVNSAMANRFLQSLELTE